MRGSWRRSNEDSTKSTGTSRRIGNLFSMECDSGLMKQAFVNLLSNAVKYSRKREHAVIEVGQTQQKRPARHLRARQRRGLRDAIRRQALRSFSAVAQGAGF